MLRRYLGILAWRSRAILVAAILIPSLLVAGSLTFDRAEPVTARLWIPQPVFLLDARMNGRSASPAALQARLMQELVATDTFADEVLFAAWVGVRGAVSNEERTRFRSRVQIVAQGDQLLTVSYRSEQAAEGVNVLTSLITVYGTSTVLIQLRNAQRRSPAAAVDLRAARAVVDRYFSGQHAARRSARTAGPAPGSSQALLTTVGATADQYRRGLSGFLPLAAGGEDLSTLRPAAFQQLDPPAVQPRSALRLAALVFEGLAGVVAVALLLAYILAASGRTASSPPRMQPTNTAIRNAESPRS
jgi:hypothetical protein